MRISDWSSDVCSSDPGWRKGQPWGFAVTTPAGLNRAALVNRTVAPRCPRVFERHSQWKTIAEWRALGLVPQGRAWPSDPDMLATLLEPDGPGDRKSTRLNSSH